MTRDLYTIAELSRRNKPRRIVTPCCRGSATLHGKPAPQYHCDACGTVYATLAPFVDPRGAA